MQCDDRPGYAEFCYWAVQVSGRRNVPFKVYCYALTSALIQINTDAFHPYAKNNVRYACTMLTYTLRYFLKK